MILFFIIALIAIKPQEIWQTVYNGSSEESWNELNWNVYNQYSYSNFSYCNGQLLFGGFGILGYGSFISQQFTLKPHYSIRISFLLWKIDSWDDEYFQLICDDEVIRSIYGKEGSQLCGSTKSSYRENPNPYLVTLSHHSLSLVVIMTSNLDEEATNESWGLQNFMIEIALCQDGCIYCDNQYDQCNVWLNFASYWRTQQNTEGWLFDNNVPLSFSICAGITIAGGNSILGQGLKIQKLLENMPPHFQILVELKLWMISNWNGFFFLNIDDQQFSVIMKVVNVLPLPCGDTQYIKLQNIAIPAFHSNTKIQIQMSAYSNEIQLLYWGIQTFDLYLKKCTFGCELCIGPLETQCTKCIKRWGFFNQKCVSVPLEITQTRLQYLSISSSNIINTIQIQFDEKVFTFDKLGQSKLIIDQSSSLINFNIQINCFKKATIKSFFKNCEECKKDQYNFLRNCNQDTSLFYTANFQAIIEAEKEFLQSRINLIFQTNLIFINICLEQQQQTFNQQNKKFINYDSFGKVYLQLILSYSICQLS